MFFEVRKLIEECSAEGTSIRFLSGVLTKVNFQSCGVCKLLRTHLAAVGFVATVGSLVDS